MSFAFNPSQLQQLCKQYGLTPSKQYGQHFLISDAPINKMIAAAELTNDDTVIEIGPGFGVLTFAIAPLVKKVIAFEIEKKLEDYWKERLKDYKIKRLADHAGEIEIVWGNFLKEITRYPLLVTGYKVLANLPYQITSHALRTMLELPHKPERIIVMVQKEVAEKMCAARGDMSLLSVSVQYYGTPKIIAKVPKGCFWPVPKVDSAVVHIKTLKHATAIGGVPSEGGKSIKTFSDEEFFRVVKAGFAHKRKQLWRNLADGLKLSPEAIKAALVEVVGNEKARAEELGVEEWQDLVEALS